MKCPSCKYEKNWDDKDAKKKEDFISIESVATIHIQYEGEKRVYLKACPKCKCVILSD